MTLPFGVGALRFAWPAALLGLVLVPLVFLRARHALAGAACRSAAVLAVVLVLAGAHLETSRPRHGACVLAAVDVSASVQDAAVDAARTFLGRLLRTLGPDDVVGSVAFFEARA